MGPHHNKFPDNARIRQLAKELRILKQTPLLDLLKMRIKVPIRRKLVCEVKVPAQ